MDPIYSILLISLIGAILCWRVWVYYQGLYYGSGQGQEIYQRFSRFALGVIVLLGLILAISLASLIWLDRGPGVELPVRAPVSSPAEPPTPTEFVSPLSAPPQLTETPAPEPTLASSTARIGNTGGAGANIRGQPGLQGPVITAAADSTQVILLEGTETVDGFIWQEIELPGGQRGWVVRNFLLLE
jgi:hypothetical protein